jgi:hypothetical protein
MRGEFWFTGKAGRLYLVYQGAGNLQADDEADAEGEVVETGAAWLLVVHCLPDHGERSEAMCC